MADRNDVFHLGVVLTPGFSLMGFASTIEPLRGANLISGRTIYRWTHLSPDGGTVIAGSGLEVLTAALPAPAEADFNMVVVCGGLGSESYHNSKLRVFLRRLITRRVIVGSVSTASFILAEAGLLDNRRCTVHWDYIEAFQEAYPHIDVRNELFVIDNRVFTCAGGTAAMDVMLQFIRQQLGDRFASAVSDQFIYGAIRQPRDAQRMALRSRLGIAHPVVVKAIETMEGATEAPLALPPLSPMLAEPLLHRPPAREGAAAAMADDAVGDGDRGRLRLHLGLAFRPGLPGAFQGGAERRPPAGSRTLRAPAIAEDHGPAKAGLVESSAARIGSA